MQKETHIHDLSCWQNRIFIKNNDDNNSKWIVLHNLLFSSNNMLPANNFVTIITIYQISYTFAVLNKYNNRICIQIIK